MILLRQGLASCVNVSVCLPAVTHAARKRGTRNLIVFIEVLGQGIRCKSTDTPVNINRAFKMATPLHHCTKLEGNDMQISTRTDA